MTCTPRRAERGFSLIEMVVALAIAALILGTVYQLVPTSMAEVGKADSYLRALGTAQSRLAEASALAVLRPGTVLGNADGVAWSRSVREVPGPPPSPQTRLYEVTVIATQRGSRVQLDTLLIAGIAHE